MDAYKTLREEAFEANCEIPRRRLSIYTWGNASAFDRALGAFAIKPSGVAYDALSADMMVVIDMEGAVVAGRLNPSSDTETHRVLYGAFDGIGGITHTHSVYAVAWAQALKAVPVFGTTHADHGPEEIPCTALMDAQAVGRHYERETGNLIVETFRQQGKDPHCLSMALVGGHGPFTWGKSAGCAVYHAAVLEEVCKMAYLTLSLNPASRPLPRHIIEKHWDRKHGSAATYGQPQPPAAPAWPPRLRRF
jgi:L-ribulose-5-phosphate 4-epimerase